MNLPKLLEIPDYPARNIPLPVLLSRTGEFVICCKSIFPKFKVHASTQMGNHNSMDCLFARKQGFQRVILARELTLAELTSIAEQLNNGLLSNHSTKVTERLNNGVLEQQSNKGSGTTQQRSV